MTHATQHSRLNSPLDRMVSIHGLDNSVEYLLRIVIQHLDIEAITGKNLDTVELASLAGEVNRYLKETYKIELPYLTEIKQIRQIRNLVQHGIVDPQPDIARVRKTVERFFERILSVVFGVKRGTLTVSSLVENPNVRKYLESSEKFIDERKYLKSITASRDAFENARHEKTKLSSIRGFLLPALVESKIDRVNLHYFLRTIGEELEVSRLGIDLANYRRFMEYVNHIPDATGNIVMQRPWNEQDARFCYDFVTNAILFWQGEEPEDLYPLNMSDKYEWQIKIGDIIIPRNTESGFVNLTENPISGNQEEMNVYFVSRKLKDKLIALKSESLTTVINKIFKNGKIDNTISNSVILLSCYARLATHEPERWEVIVWWRHTS